MTKHTLSANLRTQTGRAVKKLRRSGQVPAHVFGNHIPSQNLQVSLSDFQAVYPQVGESSLVYLRVSGETEPRPVFITTLARHPVTHHLLHVSFHQVDLKAKISAPVKINLVGESPAVKDGLGVLVQQLDEVEMEALPADMPDHLDLDISALAAIGDSLTVSSLKLSKHLTAKSDSQTIIVKIEPHAKEDLPAVAPEADGAKEGVAPATDETPTEPTKPAE